MTLAADSKELESKSWSSSFKNMLISESNPILPIARSIVNTYISKLVDRGLLIIDDKSQEGVHSRTNEVKKWKSDDKTMKNHSYPIRMVIKNPLFYIRVLVHSDLGFAESYMMEEFDVDDLTGLLRLFVANRDSMNNLSLPLASLTNFASYLVHTQRLSNTLSHAFNNISEHYDIGNELFVRFLDSHGDVGRVYKNQADSLYVPETLGKDVNGMQETSSSYDIGTFADDMNEGSMMYSSAIWAQGDSDEDLSRAQWRKINSIIAKANIKSEDKVLEIGSGWGTVAIEIARRYGCKVISITLSQEQLNFANDRLKYLPPSLASLVSFELMDFRHLLKNYPAHYFTKIVSIEMIEAIGPDLLRTYFEICDRMLDQKSGVMVFQCITMPETRYEQYLNNVDFIQKYIFPGGHCPSITALVESIRKGSNGNLILNDLDNIGTHYARTLRVWRDRFLKKFDQLKAFPKFIGSDRAGLMASLNTILNGMASRFLSLDTKSPPENFYSEQFKRKWVYYFSYCEAGFAERTLGNVQIVLGRESSWETVADGRESWSL